MAAAPPVRHLFTAVPAQDGLDRSAMWRIASARAVSGAPLADAGWLVVSDGAPPADAAWWFAGTTSHLRYTRRTEADALAARSPALARPEARRAALIAIRKSAAWWALAQDERDAIYVRSRHREIGLDYLPAVARRLYHARDAGGPFDFLTWFEFAPEHAPAFDALLKALRATEEWRYVEREIELRLERR